MNPLAPPPFDEAQETEAPAMPPAFDEAADTEPPPLAPAFDEAKDVEAPPSAPEFTAAAEIPEVAPAPDTLGDDYSGLWANLKIASKNLGQSTDMMGLLAMRGRMDDVVKAEKNLTAFDEVASKLEKPIAPFYAQEQAARVRERRMSLEGKLAMARHEAEQAKGYSTEMLNRIATRAKSLPELEAQLSPEMKKWNQARGWDAVAAFVTNPAEVTTNVVLTSMITSVPAIGGAAVGSAVGPVGTAVGAGMGSYAVEYSNGILDAFQEAGVDLTDPRSVSTALATPGILEDAKKYAVARGVPIAIFDAASAGLAGKIVGPVLRDPVKQGAKAVLKATGKEIGVQAVAGAGGEAAAQVVTMRPGDVKSMFMEALGELVPTEAATNLLAERKRVAAPVAAAGAPATAAAVEGNPATATALALVVTPSRNYAEEARQKLAAMSIRPPVVEDEREQIEYAPWETEGGQPGIGEREDGSVEFPARVASETMPEPPPVKPEEQAAVDGVPVQRVASAAIVTRPDLMQFKRMDDPVSGVNETEKLAGEWDDLKAGNLLLWEPANPAEHGLKEGERYIVANGHHRREFGERAGVTGYNSQVIREADGYSASDALRMGAEINIADGKGTIYDQARYLRNQAATLGETDAKAAGERIGARGRKAAAIAFLSGDTLFGAFVNERISPDATEAIASAAPNHEGAQRHGLKKALEGKSALFAANYARAAIAKSGGKAETLDLFGDDADFNREMDEAAEIATQHQRDLREQILSVRGAAKRPEAAAKLGVNVSDPEGIQKRVKELEAELERWVNWPMHPDLLKIATGQDPTAPTANADGRAPAGDMFAGTDSDPFNLVSETTAERKAREAREEAERLAKEEEQRRKDKEENDRNQGEMFAPPSLRNPLAVGAVVERNGRKWTVTRDLGSAVELTGESGATLVVSKTPPIDRGTLTRLVNVARVTLSDFLANVRHAQTLYDGDGKASMYVQVGQQDGEPRIYVNWDELEASTAGMSEAEAQEAIMDGLRHEIIHVAEVRFQAARPDLAVAFIDWITHPSAEGHDPSLFAFMEKEYPGFADMAPYQKAAETARAIIEQRWLGRLSRAALRYLAGLADFLKRWVVNIDGQPSFVRDYIEGIERVLAGQADVSGRGNSGETRNAPSSLRSKLREDVSEYFHGQVLMERDGQIDADALENAASNALERAMKLGIPEDVARQMLSDISTGYPPDDALNDAMDAVSRSTDAAWQRAMNGDEAAFDELDAIKRARLGEPPTGKVGESRAQRFFSTEEFEKFFNARFAAKDFDAILDAVKASDVKIYQPLLKKLFRAQATDPDAAARADWLRAVFNGTRPPDAKPPAGTTATPPPGGPTPPPTTPRPQPGAGAQAGASTPPPTTPPPPPPPPPPPRPTGKHPFNIPALVAVARLLGQLPTINDLLSRVRGRFVQGPDGVRVELNAQIFKNPAQAARTLAHEIGHFFDFIPAAVPRAGLASKLAPLRNWKAIFGPLWDWSGGKISEVQRLLQLEAIQLSRSWRGDFGPTDRYRNSAEELYADFISALLNDPDWTFTVAPRTSAAFFAGIAQKPEVENAYNLVNELLRSDTLLNVLRAQQEQAGQAAVERIISETIARTAEMGALRRAWTAFYGGFLNKFGPTMSKAGGYREAMLRRQREFGTDYVTEMETAETFSDRRTYLMYDRLWSGTYRLLQSMGIADTYLDTYLRNRRIIHERTATGIYIEQNPDEARELFKWMASEARLEGRWHSQIDSAADVDLYDLGARLVYDLHEQNLFDQVLLAAQRRSAPEFAEQGLFAFDVSGFMLNPQGIDPENAQRQIDQMRGELGPDRFDALQRAAANYYATMREIVLDANRLGLFRPKTWNERIAPNLRNYVPFFVIDYFTGHVDAGLRQRRGTARDVLPVHLAGQMKMAALLRRMQRQRQALLTQNFYRTEGTAHGFADELTIHEERLTDSQISEIERQGHGVIGYYHLGEWRHMEFEDGASVAAMQQFDPDDLGTLLAIGRSQSNFWRLIFTTYSVSFTLWNALRTVRQAWASHGTRNLVNLARSIPEAENYARAVVYGDPLSPGLRALVDTGALPSPDRSLAGQGSPEMLRQMILAGIVGAENMVNRTPHAHQSTMMRVLRMPLGWLFDGIAYLSGIVESVPKIATNRTLTERGASPEQAAAFARLEGIPNPGISGKYNSAVEVALMFARVQIQGLRAFRTRVSSPMTRGGYLTRAVLSQLVWKGLYVAAAAGVIDAMFGSDDEGEEQVDWAEFVKRSTPYKLEMDDLIFLGWVKPDGGYEAPAGHSKIPLDWTPLTIRIPHSEDGRYISPISAVSLTTLFNSEIRPVNAPQRALQIAQSFVPGMNPGIEMASAAWQIDNDEPPQDTYRGRPMVPPDEWKAGLGSKTWGLTKHFMATVGVPGIHQKVGNENLNWFWTVVRNVPGLGRLTPLDNFYGVREQQRTKQEEETTRARANNMRGDQTVLAVRRMNALERKGSPDGEKKHKRTEAEEREYQRLREWNSTYYEGTIEAPGLLHTLRAKAAGKPDIDADFAVDRLEETAKEALEDARRRRD